METHANGYERLKEIARKAYAAADRIAPKNPYHNMEHNLDVANTAWMLAKMEKLDDHDALIAWLAGIFHDCVYIQGREDNELKSAENAREFLLEEGFPAEDAMQVYRGIIPTKVPQDPHCKLEEIVVDSDIANMGRPDFTVKSEKLRCEWGIDPQTWAKKSLEILKCIKYRTASARALYEEGRRENIKYLEGTGK